MPGAGKIGGRSFPSTCRYCLRKVSPPPEPSNHLEEGANLQNWGRAGIRIPPPPGLVSAMGKRGEKRKVIPQKGRSPRLREEKAAALFWQAECPFAWAREKLSESQKIMKIIRLLPPTNWENILKKCRCSSNDSTILQTF